MNKEEIQIAQAAYCVGKMWDEYEGTEDFDRLVGKRVQHLIELVHNHLQKKQMPDSTQLIAEWEKEKAMLEQKDFRGDAERMTYNAFLDGFIKGLGYEGTK